MTEYRPALGVQSGKPRGNEVSADTVAIGDDIDAWTWFPRPLAELMLRERRSRSNPQLHERDVRLARSQDFVTVRDDWTIMLLRLLTQHKDRVLARWYEYVLESYPQEARKFLKNQKNRFSNPVGASIAEGLDGIYEGLIQGTEITPETMTEFLDKLVRIRAVQEFSPSQALQFIFLLKNAIRETLKRELADKSVLEDLLTLESRIDKLALLSFDLYMQCRTQLYEIRLHEIRHSTARTWERICRKYGITDEPSESHDDDSTLR